jgi:hypothetical protein
MRADGFSFTPAIVLVIERRVTRCMIKIAPPTFIEQRDISPAVTATKFENRISKAETISKFEIVKSET